MLPGEVVDWMDCVTSRPCTKLSGTEELRSVAVDGKENGRQSEVRVIRKGEGTTRK